MLIKCRECGREVSTRASACPHCGCPIWQPTEGTPTTTQTRTEKKKIPLIAWLALLAVLLLLARCGANGWSGAGSSGGAKTNKESDYKAATYTLAEQQVKAHLKAPSTASFCRMSETEFSKTGSDQYVMSGWVDAENSFGAKLRSSWEIAVQVKGEKIVMQELKIDGKTAYP